MEVSIMEDFIKKLVEFVLFLVNTIKDMVANLTGKVKPEEDQTSEPASE